MKFLCVNCNEPMKLQQAKPPENGSAAAVFTCPECLHTIAMLMNPYETQMVQSLGVEIRASPPLSPQGDGAGQEAGEAQQASGCPFSGMLADMEAKAADAGGVAWTEEALARLRNIPEFVRPMAKQGIESFARSNGHTTIDDAVMEEARGRFGM